MFQGIFYNKPLNKFEKQLREGAVVERADVVKAGDGNNRCRNIMK